jgi:hypothetical protein
VIALIINYNRLTLPSRMADYLASCEGVEPIFIDNFSDYGPLLEYYEETPYRVIKLPFNFGSCAPWHPATGILDTLDLHGGFVVTDPDLIIDHVPKDWPQVLQEGLDKFPDVCKSGFSLRISDLPDTAVGRQARNHEQGHWYQTGDPRFYRASIDTTFCLCRTRLHDFPAVRSAPPYDAIHKPWYYTSLDDMAEDEIYYMRSEKGRGSTFWTSKIMEMLGE